MFVPVVIVLLTGCSADSAKRTAYETLQNVRQQECIRNGAQDCGQRESYDDY
jgi:outer membrane biogenesis lipoprotein LolB